MTAPLSTHTNGHHPSLETTSNTAAAAAAAVVTRNMSCYYGGAWLAEASEKKCTCSIT
jgi:hypothetical protein